MKLKSLSLTIKTLGLLFLVGISSQAHAVRLKEIPELIHNPRSYLLAHPEFLSGQLKSMTATRCYVYSKKNASWCDKAAKDMIAAMEIEPIQLEDPKTQEKANYIVTFSSQLLKLHDEQRSLAFLQDLNRQLDRLEKSLELFQMISPQAVQPLDIGKLAFQYYGSRDEALRALAILFQDLPLSEIQVHFLYNKFGRDPFVTLLHKTVGRIAALRFSRQSSPLTLFGQRFYNSKIYHVLVPSYLALQLKARGHDETISMLIPFLMNYLYETSEAVGSFRTYFMEPRSIPTIEAQNDIRAAELGALLGIGRPGLILSEDEARTLLAHRPGQYLRRLVESLQAK